MANDETDDRLEELEERIEEIRERAADDPGFDIIDEDEVPAYFEDDRPNVQGGITKEEAARRDPGRHQGHAPG